MSQGLSGRVAIVTGGAGRIGRASVEALAKSGAKVAVADLDLTAAAAVAEAVKREGGDAIAMAADVADEAGVEAMAARAREAFGRIDILYANAAALGPEMQQDDRDVACMSVETWDKVMAVNLRGAMLCTKHVLPAMLEGGGGSIIYASSGMGFQGEITRSAYAASKAGLMMLAKSVATQYGKKGVRANAVQIGYLPPVDTKKSTLPEVVDILTSHNLIPHTLKAEHIANVVAFLAGDGAAAITGQTIVADGGFSAHTPTMNDMLKLLERSGRNEM